MMDYRVVYSDRKTVRITVERDRSIVVRAPHHASKEQLEDLLRRKRVWLYEKLNHPQKFEEVKPKELVSGEALLYLGKSYRLDVLEDEFEGVRFDGRFCISQKSQTDAVGVLGAWFKERAEGTITPLVEEVAANLGVAYNRVLISDLKYRWGSCTPNDNLNFNWRLIKAPMFVIKYVVAHELAHLLEPNHTVRFWNIVYVQAPRYVKAKAWLKVQGQTLYDGF